MNRPLALITTTPDLTDPGVVVCPTCAVDFDVFDRPGEPGYFAAEHNRLHHRGNPVAFVTTVDEPADPTGQAGPAELVFRGRFIGGMPGSGKTGYALGLVLAGLGLDSPVAELDPTGGEAA